MWAVVTDEDDTVWSLLFVYITGGSSLSLLAARASSPATPGSLVDRT
jgi:hypothetical protein